MKIFGIITVRGGLKELPYNNAFLHAEKFLIG